MGMFDFLGLGSKEDSYKENLGNLPTTVYQDPNAGLGDVYYKDFKPQLDQMGQTIGGMQGTVADIQKRADAPLGLSEAYGKAAEVVQQQKIAGLEEAGKAGQQAGMRAISQGGMYGSSGGGSRERALARGAKTAQDQQQAVRRGTQQQLGKMASSDLQSGLSRKHALQDQILGAQGQIANQQRGLAGMYAPAMQTQQGILSSNVAMENATNQARYKAENAARANASSGFTDLLSLGGTIVGGIYGGPAGAAAGGALGKGVGGMFD